MGFKLLNLTRKEPTIMALKIVFSLVYLAVVQAKHIDSNQNENWSNWQRGSHQHFEPSNYYMRARNFATMYHDANRGRMSGKEFPREVFQEMEGHARRSGCNRGCLMRLSHIKCTDKMKEFSPERCHTYGGSDNTAHGSMHHYGGFGEMEPMAQVTQCEDCTSKCLKGLAHVHCSDHLRKWMPQICSQFGDEHQSQVDTI